MAHINSLIGFWNNKSEEAEQRNAAKPRSEHLRIKKWEKNDDIISVKKLPVIQMEKRAAENFKETNRGEIKTMIRDENSNEADPKLEKTSIKSGNLTRPSSYPSSPTPGQSCSSTPSPRQKPVSPFFEI